MARLHAKEAVRLLREKRVEGFEILQRSDSDIVRIATDIALGLQSGKMWVITWMILFILATGFRFIWQIHAYYNPEYWYVVKTIP